MSDPYPRPRGHEHDDDPTLSRAADQLHAQSSRRWVEVAGDVLSQVVSASRRSLPVLVQVLEDGATVCLSEQVVVTRLRAALDASLTQAATARIHLDVAPDQRLRQVTVELLARYGAELIPLADEARGVVRGQLAVWMAGDPMAGVLVLPAHVHVGDVVNGDPHLRDPHDPV